MSGTIQYGRVEDPKRFDSLEAPALIKYRPGRIIVEVDGREFRDDPAFIAALDRVSIDLVSPYRMLAAPLAGPSLSCQLHRVRRVAGGRLVAYEIIDDVAYVEIPTRAMSNDMASALTALGASVGHYLAPL